MKNVLTQLVHNAFDKLRLFGPHSEEYKMAYSSVEEARAKLRKELTEQELERLAREP